MTKRIIASVIVKQGRVVQSIGMARYLPLGSPEVVVEFLDRWGADEIVVLEIDPPAGGAPDLALVGRLAKHCSVPLAYGGGVRDINTMRALIAGGADKIVINRAAHERPELIAEAAAVFGNQCIVVSIDVRAGEEAQAVEHGKEYATLGAGELLVRSVERDGSKVGYDVGLIRAVSEAVSVPVIAAGGCGSASHIVEAFAAGAEAAAVGNMLHFTEHSVILLKQELRRMGTPVRLDTYATYDGFSFDERGRPQKRDDDYLSKLRFEYHPPETI